MAERRFDRVRRLTLPPAAPTEAGAVSLADDLKRVFSLAGAVLDDHRGDGLRVALDEKVAPLLESVDEAEHG